MIKRLLCKLGWHKWTGWGDVGIVLKWPVTFSRACKWCKLSEKKVLEKDDFKWYGGYAD